MCVRAGAWRLPFFDRLMKRATNCHPSGRAPGEEAWRSGGARGCRVSPDAPAGARTPRRRGGPAQAAPRLPRTPRAPPLAPPRRRTAPDASRPSSPRPLAADTRRPLQAAAIARHAAQARPPASRLGVVGDLVHARRRREQLGGVARVDGAAAAEQLRAGRRPGGGRRTRLSGLLPPQTPLAAQLLRGPRRGALRPAAPRPPAPRARRTVACTPELTRRPSAFHWR